MTVIRDAGRFEIRKGDIFVDYFENRPRMLRVDVIAKEGLHFVNFETGEEKYYRYKNFRKRFLHHQIVKLENFTEAGPLSKELERKCEQTFASRSPEAQDEGRRSNWCMQELDRLVEKCGAVTDEAITCLHQAAQEKFGTIAGLSRPRLFEKRKLWLASGRKIESVTPDYENRGNRDDKVDSRVAELTNAVIIGFHATRERPSRTATYNELIRRIAEENLALEADQALTIPSPEYLKRRINRFNQYLLDRERHGELIARQMHGHFGGGEVCTRPLEVVEIDHTPLDIIAIDDDFRVVIGRIYLTIAIDRFTRCILGFSVDYEKPSYHSVAKCLAHAISFKDEFIERFGLRMGYPCHGIPQRILVDNAKEFHSVALESMCDMLRIQIEYTPKRKAHFKGAVERVIRTVNKDNFQNVRGHTFSNYLQRGEYKSEERTFALVSNIEEAMYILVTEIYHQSGHSSLLAKPIDTWLRHIEEFPPRMPNSQSDLDIAMGRELPEPKPVHHYGVELNYLKYGGPGVSIIRNHPDHRPGKKYRIKVMPDDVTTIYVLCDGKWLRLEVDGETRKLVAGFSIKHWTTLRSFTLREFRKSIDKVGIAQAIGRFRQTLTALVARLDKRVARPLLDQLKTGKAAAGRAGDQHATPVSGDQHMFEASVEDEDLGPDDDDFEVETDD